MLEQRSTGRTKKNKKEKQKKVGEVRKKISVKEGRTRQKKKGK